MALVVEDGTGVAGANTFVDRADCISYAAARGVTLADTEATDAMLIKAMDYLQTVDWIGSPVVDFQVLPFPRNNMRFLAASSITPQAIGYGGYSSVYNDIYGGMGYAYGYGGFFPGRKYTTFPNDQVPVDIPNAQCQLVLQQTAGIDIMPTISGAFVTQRTVGPITRKFSDKFGPGGSPDMPTVTKMLEKWIKSGGPLRTVRA